MVGAYLGAFATVSAFLLVYLRHRYRNRFATGNIRLHKNMVVRFFHITINKLYVVYIFQGKGKTGGNQCLTRSSFTTGNGYYHLILLTSHHLRATFGTAEIVAGRSYLMGYTLSAIRTDAFPAGAGPGPIASHPTTTTSASTYTSPHACSATSRWSGSISSRHFIPPSWTLLAICLNNLTRSFFAPYLYRRLYPYHVPYPFLSCLPYQSGRER